MSLEETLQLLINENYINLDEYKTKTNNEKKSCLFLANIQYSSDILEKQFEYKTDFKPLINIPLDKFLQYIKIVTKLKQYIGSIYVYPDIVLGVIEYIDYSYSIEFFKKNTEQQSNINADKSRSNNKYLDFLIKTKKIFFNLLSIRTFEPQYKLNDNEFSSLTYPFILETKTIRSDTIDYYTLIYKNIIEIIETKII